MSLPTSAILTRITNRELGVKRLLPNFRPSIWGDRFLSYPTTSMEHDGNLVRHQRLKEEVQRMMRDPVEKLSEKLELIDAIQHLGMSYHFEKEIDDLLGGIYECHSSKKHVEIDEDLYPVALCFRLLRQQGYKIPSDVFNKFKDNKGNFKESLVHDMRGMFCLYEASHLSVHGEDILDEALEFSTTNLELMVHANYLSPSLTIQISRTLKRPIRKCLPRLEAKHYFATYKESATSSEVLMKFAKLDFNILQQQHQKELCHLSRWWKDNLDVAEKLPFARDRVVELYFWGLVSCFEPQYSLARKIFTKIACVTSVIDDAYDAYGTYEELELFTSVVERWERSCVDQLPEYMKLVYNALLDVFEEIEEEMSKEGKLYCIYYTKEVMKKLVESYFVEAKWLNDNYTPTVEEYMSNARVSCAYFLLTTVTFAGMGENAAKEAFDWLFNHPKILKEAETICRLMDDIVSNELEQQREHVASIIECYMKQHGVSKQEAIDEFQKQIVSSWKDINKELILRPTQVPMPLLVLVLNLVRVMDLLYKDEDAYTQGGEVLIEGITLLLVDPVPI